jgi:PhoH-like ATPase
MTVKKGDMTMIYIADTNVLMSNPEVLEEYEVVIPSHVNREIEHLELTRKSDRTLQWQIRRLKGKLDEKDNAYVNIKDYKFSLDDDLDPQYTDNILLQVAVDEGYGIITNDKLLRRKCRQFGIPFIKLEVSNFIEHKGFKEVFMLSHELPELYATANENTYELLTNEYLVVYDDAVTDELVPLEIMKWNGTSMEALKRNKKGELHMSFTSKQFGDFEPKDAQQMMAVDSILNNQITQLRGRAGSGKSKIALETAWHLVEREGKRDGFERLVIFVNPTPTRDSQELGFYKGDKVEKLMQSAVGTMLASKFGAEEGILAQMALGKLEILPFVDLRGYETGDRKTIVWILEAQNLTTDLMKLGLQRISENTKVIIDGDFHAQVDKDAYALDNGMKRVSEVFRGEDLYGEVELQNIYRSRIADIADKM